VFAERRRRLLEAMEPDSVAILLGARLAARSADTHFPFRQDSDFHYLTGFDHPNAAAVLRTDGEPAFSLYVEPRQREAEIWNGYRPGSEGAVGEYGADAAHPSEQLLDDLAGLLENRRRIYTVIGRDTDFDRRLVAALEEMRLRSRQGKVPPAEIVDPRGIVHEMRLRKEAAEIEIMRRASAISAEAHHEAARLAHGGHYEYELEAVLDYTFRRRGASGPAYHSIVGGGRNACILHYIANDQKLENGQLVLIDAGCELEGYASDVTRTYPVGGRFEGPARALYEAVLDAQQAALAEARPGATLVALHQTAVRRLTANLVELGIMDATPDEAVETELYRDFYMHQTSHWLGLDVHDVGSYAIDGEPRPLEPGMVFTVEPGLYVAPDREGVEAQFRGIGVRIEDDVVLTHEGCEVLTESLPKLPDDLEAWVRDA
jgi:Xaa-Pro aminopeptidase